MCSRYEAPTPERLHEEFGVAFDPQEKLDLRPNYIGPFLRKPLDADHDDEAVPAIEALVGVFGLLPHWAKDRKLARSTYNSRSETAAIKPSFRGAWKEAKHCIIPAVAIYEPDWRPGKPVPTRIWRTDGKLLGIAGLWEKWHAPTGEVLHSYSMLTINADDHALMSKYHRSEKGMRLGIPSCATKPVATYAAAAPQSHLPAASAGA